MNAAFPGVGTYVAVPYLISLWLTLTLSCSFSEQLFGWLLNLPVHLVGFLADRWDGRSGAEQKAFDAFEPISSPETVLKSTARPCISGGLSGWTSKVNQQNKAAAASLLDSLEKMGMITAGG